jgi:biopolymer transport protein ExbB/TolQ
MMTANGIDAQALDLMLRAGSRWVLWLLLGLSVAGLAVVLERLFFYARERRPRRRVEEMLASLRKSGPAAALEALGQARSMDTAVARVCLENNHDGPAAIEEHVAATIEKERLRYERGLAFIGTLGNNAPFVGLFGTVLGIVRSFHDLATSTAQGTQAVMAGIAEALVATGVGLQIRYNDLPDAVLCVLGEGTTNIGYFHESMNLAAIWKLPVVFLVENNQYGMGTEVGRASALTNIYEKGCAYGVENQQFNGQDVVETYEVMAHALAYARQEGPVLLEAITYRYVGHSMGDPERYRTKAEIEWWRERDPLCRIEDQMTADGRASFDDFTRIQGEVAAEVDAIVKFAEESPEPADAALWEHIYVNPIGEGERRE